MDHAHETVIVGGGQGGLSTSYYLRQMGHDHVVLDQAAQAANAWRNDRWDSFTLVTPNWSVRLPGAEYRGDNPNGFMGRDEIITYFEAYIDTNSLPVRYGTRVMAIEPVGDGVGYLVKTGDATFQAKNVVMATGLFQQPKKLPFSDRISPAITQLHSSQYRNPRSLPKGAVLVVGSGQSGCQIAEELYQHDRQVYLCVGGAPRIPRRYRGRDLFEWLLATGFADRAADKLPSPRARFSGSGHVSGRDDGHSLNLHQFARDGVILLGRLRDGEDHQIWLASDLQEELAAADKIEADIVKMIDDYIAANSLDVPAESLPQLTDGQDAPDIRV